MPCGSDHPDLSLLRDEIDRTDRELLTLFLHRMGLAEEVARYKRAHGLPVLHAEREREILDRAATQAGEEMAPYAFRFFEALMALSRQLQSSCLGEE